MEKVFDIFRPERIYVSSTVVENINFTQLEFDEICNLSEQYNASVYIGGQGFDYINYEHQVVKKRINSFEELFNFD